MCIVKYSMLLKTYCHFFTGFSTQENTEKYKTENKRLAIVKEMLT